MDKNHPTFIIAIEKKLTNLLNEIKASYQQVKLSLTI